MEATIAAALVFRICSKPIGARLLAIAAVFALQGALPLVIYNYWRAAGYGPTIAKPLLLHHALTLIGLAVPFDITRQ